MPHVRELEANVAVTAGFVEFADGDTPSPYRMTWVLVRHDGNWRITQHHGSPRLGTRNIFIFQLTIDLQIAIPDPDELLFCSGVERPLAGQSQLQQTS